MYYITKLSIQVIEKVSKMRKMGVGKRRRKKCKIGQNIIMKKGASLDKRGARLDNKKGASLGDRVQLKKGARLGKKGARLGTSLLSQVNSI
jgi:hypothetical protein